MVEDYTYARPDFRGDRDLPLPKGNQWDDRGEKNTIPCVFILC